MAERLFGLFKGIEQYRHVLYCALWTQIEGTEHKTIYRVSIARSNHGNLYTWEGPEIAKAGSRLEGFVTGRPEIIVVGKIPLDSSAQLDDWASELSKGKNLQPHEFVVALLRKLENHGSYTDRIRKNWSLVVQEWWDTQDLVIPSQQEMEARRSRPYGTRVTEKYDSLHQIVENCPITDGVIKVSEQREFYNPRTPPGMDPVKDGLFRRGGSRTPSPLQSPTTSSNPSSSSLGNKTPYPLTRANRAATLPIITRAHPPPPPLKTRFSQSVPRPLHNYNQYTPSPPCSPQTPRTSSTKASKSNPSTPHGTTYPSSPLSPRSPHPHPDPRLRAFEARKRSISAPRQHLMINSGSSRGMNSAASGSSSGGYSGRLGPPPRAAMKLPRSKSDQRRRKSESHHYSQSTTAVMAAAAEKKQQQVDVVKTVVKLLAATAMTVV